MKQVKVIEIYKLHDRSSIDIPEDTPLDILINLITNNFVEESVFVTNSKHQFRGLVKKSSLVRWAHIKITGGKGRYEIPVWEFFRIADAKRVGDLALIGPELSVKENDSAQVALDKMLDYCENTLPVVDDDKRIVGDLSLSDILTWIQISERELNARHRY